jgi:putative ABC transport system substrate-binding protein
LTGQAENDPDAQARLAAFLKALQQLGWIDGTSVRIESRWGAGNVGLINRYAEELIALAPDVILATGGSTMGPLRHASETVPIVFVQVPDPVGAGFVASLAQPGANVTGFTQYEFGISAKWLGLLKQIAPGVTRAAVLRDATTPDGIGQLAAMQGVAPSFGIELIPVDVRDASKIERSLTTFARVQDGGLIVTGSGSAIGHRTLIVTLAMQHRLPAIYPYRVFPIGGGLMSYGPDTIDPYRRAASYVDRILRGEKAANLPVQHPTKFELIINLKAARALGLIMPPSLVSTADEVIE